MKGPFLSRQQNSSRIPGEDSSALPTFNIQLSTSYTRNQVADLDIIECLAHPNSGFEHSERSFSQNAPADLKYQHRGTPNSSAEGTLHDKGPLGNEISFFSRASSDMYSPSLLSSKEGTTKKQDRRDDAQSADVEQRLTIKDIRPVAGGVVPSPPGGFRPDEKVCVFLEEEHDKRVSTTGDEPSAPCLGFIQHLIPANGIIDLDGEDGCSEESELYFLHAEDVASHEKESRDHQESSMKHYPLRNSPILDPFRLQKSVQYRDLLLREGKSIELPDGDFLHISHIIENSLNGEVLLRGHRLQRCSSMNGMLEKKLNEVCLFYEIDLDDRRNALEQSVIEIPLKDIKKLRNIRCTNQKFPNARNVDISDFQNQQDAAADGGLTIRWKYTCKYASAAHRYRNEYIERALEHINENECPAAVTDSQRRFEWRGETIAGGSYLPETLGEDTTLSSMFRGERFISISSSTSNLSPPVMIIRSRSSSVVKVGGSKKRGRASFQVLGHAPDIDTYPKSKKVCYDKDEIKTTAEGIKQISLDVYGEELEGIVDLESRPSIAITNPLPSQIDRALSSRRSPQYGSIHFPTPSGSQVKTRSPGQMLTYGDAFCGAGGTTRGAVMAGLHVKWGFDFSKHACETWRENFPHARCYAMAADQFVQVAQQAARAGFKEIMKVDILHLSPPCQYFSDAHTVNGKDDDMNTASLFAVRDVIDVVKPRIVTLEQTFGITRTRFVWYLSALIQMFTSLDFSVRWAVVRLAQWVIPFSLDTYCLIDTYAGPTTITTTFDNHSSLVSASS